MRFIWTALLLIGCASKEEPAKPAKSSADPVPPPAAAPTEAKADPPAAPQQAAAGCGERAAQLDKRLHELAAAAPGFLPAVRDITAPAAPGGKPFDTRGFVVGVGRDGAMYMQGEKIAKTDQLREYLHQASMKAYEKLVLDNGNPKDAKFPLYVWADREAPASAVATVLATASAVSDHFAPRLLVAGAGAKPAGPTLSPKVSEVAAKLPASEPDATKYLAMQLRGAIGECKPMIMALATSSLEGIPQKETEKLAKEVPAGL